MSPKGGAQQLTSLEPASDAALRRLVCSCAENPGRGLDVSELIARRAGELRGRLAGHRVVREQADMLIAATAPAHRLTPVTRNTKDFENCGIGLLNPFSNAG